MTDRFPSGSGSITVFLDRLRVGEPAAAEAIWERFFPRLVALARKTLAGRPQRVADAADAAQSAFASCHRLKAGEFDLQNRGDLWNLLGAIAANKARQQTRRENAAKRGGGTVVGEDALRRPDGSPLPLDEAAAAADAAEVDLHCEELLGMLDPELREFALLRLFGYTNAEVAALHGCTERRIERKMNLSSARRTAAHRRRASSSFAGARPRPPAGPRRSGCPFLPTSS